MHDTWAARDLPVLDATIALLEHSFMVTVTDIAARCELAPAVVAAALEALDPVYVDFRKTTTGGDPRYWYVFKVTPEARRAVGQWPTAEALASRLAEELAAQARHEVDDERHGLLVYAARLVGDTLRDATVRAAARVLAPAFGGVPVPELGTPVPQPEPEPQDDYVSLVELPELPELLRSRNTAGGAVEDPEPYDPDEPGEPGEPGEPDEPDEPGEPDEFETTQPPVREARHLPPVAEAQQLPPLPEAQQWPPLPEPDEPGEPDEVEATQPAVPEARYLPPVPEAQQLPPLPEPDEPGEPEEVEATQPPVPEARHLPPVPEAQQLPPLPEAQQLPPLPEPDEPDEFDELYEPDELDEPDEPGEPTGVQPQEPDARELAPLRWPAGFDAAVSAPRAGNLLPPEADDITLQ